LISSGLNTRSRPLPSHKVGPDQALAFFTVNDRDIPLFTRQQDGQCVQQTLVGCQTGWGRTHHIIGDDSAEFLSSIQVLFKILQGDHSHQSLILIHYR
jgi:hypothetical protein